MIQHTSIGSKEWTGRMLYLVTTCNESKTMEVGVPYLNCKHPVTISQFLCMAQRTHQELFSGNRKHSTESELCNYFYMCSSSPYLPIHQRASRTCIRIPPLRQYRTTQEHAHSVTIIARHSNTVVVTE